ncbi:MAG: DUF2510 domain-containing protein [Candidatus Nanopelagicales bacterium]
MSNPIPGWYPDPEDSARQRFWDGNHWTDARAYPAVASAPEAGIAQVEAEQATARSWRAVALIAILAAALLAAAYFFLVRNSGSDTPAPTPVEPTVVPSLPTSIPTPTIPTPTLPTEIPSP